MKDRTDVRSGHAPPTTCSCGCGGHVYGAVGPEVAQARAARAALRTPVPREAVGGYVERVAGDVGTPQRFPAGDARARIMLREAAAGTDTAWSPLPGRPLVVPSAWDGEPGTFDPFGRQL